MVRWNLKKCQYLLNHCGGRIPAKSKTTQTGNCPWAMLIDQTSGPKQTGMVEAHKLTDLLAETDCISPGPAIGLGQIRSDVLERGIEIQALPTGFHQILVLQGDPFDGGKDLPDAFQVADQMQAVAVAWGAAGQHHVAHQGKNGDKR